MARTIEFFLDLFQLEGNTLIPVSKVDADLECVKDKQVHIHLMNSQRG